MVAFFHIDLGEYLRIPCCDIGYCLGWCGRLVSFSFYISVEMWQVNAHADVISSFLGCYYYGGAPFSRVRYRCDYALFFQALELCFQLSLYAYGMVLGV